ncbi:MAG: YkgJ family cysteine cluster protein [Desulfatirhabdiaceae bacterium]
MQNPDNGQTISTCRRCGACCRKGGPSLHHADRFLVESGVIPLADLWTIRVGELVHDPVTGAVYATEQEIVKITGRGNRRTCLYYDEAENACDIYENRPIECRLLKCWDTRDIEKAYARDRLDRKAVLSSIAGMWDLIGTHEIRCSVIRYIELSQQMKSGPTGEARRDLQEMMVYDREIRQLTCEKTGIDPSVLPFLFGRPLTKLKIGL